MEKEFWMFSLPISSSEIGNKTIVRYHGGVAVVRQASFDFRDDKPELETSPVGFNTQFGTYYFRRESSNPRNLETFLISVYPDRDEQTIKVRRQIEDSLRKIPEFLGRAIAALS